MTRRCFLWLVGLLAVALCRGTLAGEANETAGGRGTFASAAIVSGDKAADLERLATREVQRYLYCISGTLLPVAGEEAWSQSPSRPLILVGTPQGNRLVSRLAAEGRIDASADSLGEQGFLVKSIDGEGRPLVVIAAATPVGVLYGAYTLLEQMGIGFYLGGDTFPGHRLPLDIPAGLDLRQKPVFAVRGSLPWYNFLNSPTTWDLDDFKYFFDQIAKMKQNFVGFHTYDSEPFAPYADEKGTLVQAEPLVTSLNYGWGAVRGLRTDQFGFGTGDYFDQERFGSRAVTESKSREDAIRRAQALLAAGLNYGKERGVRVCVGFEVGGDPTRPESQRALEARLRELVRAYPMLDYVWLWQSEGLGGGSDAPLPDSPLGILIEKQKAHFEYLKDPRRIAEAIRVSEYIRLGHAILKRLAPQMRLVTSGWGGDRWMGFNQFYEGFDKTLPGDVIFAALDNIDPGAEPNVGAVYGKLSPQRERWPIPWYESDGGPRRDQFCPETNAKEFTFLCRDARKKGCQGLLAIHWRTRDVEEVAAYTAQFAWEPELSYEAFYRRFAAKCFGPDHAEQMGAILRRLESLGPRWTGGGGQSECGYFAWFEGGLMPKAVNLSALDEIRGQVAAIRASMQAKGQRAGLERVEHLLATIDWVETYDAAALKLHPGGLVAKLIAEAVALKAQGQPQAAAEKARSAQRALLSSGLDEALRIFPRKLSTRGEFGALATINVKAYAAYLKLAEQIAALLPAGEAAGKPEPFGGATKRGPGGPTLLEVVVKTPPSLVPEHCPIALRAAVVGPARIAEVKLGYRTLGEREFRYVKMAPVFRKTYEGVIPGEAVTVAGIEMVVEARDAAGGVAHAPKGFPDVTYSATVTPRPKPAVFLTQCGALPKAGADYRIEAMALGRPAGTSVRLYYRPAGTSGDFRSRPVTNLFYDSLAVTVPGSEIGPRGIEYFLQLEGPWGGKWSAPPEGAGRPQEDAPDTVPPSAVAGLKAQLSDPYEIRLSWEPAADNVGVREYEIYRAGHSAPRALVCTTFKTEHYDTGVKAGQTYRYTVRARDTAGNVGPAQEASVAVPQYPPPAAPQGVKATPGRGKVKLSWNAMGLPVIGYNVYRSTAGGKPTVLNSSGPIRSTAHLDLAKDTVPATYTVRAVDRGGQEGAASPPVTVTPLPRLDTPVVALHFENSPNAESGLKGTLVGKAGYAPGVVGQALDLRLGGWLAIPHDEAFDLVGDLTLEAWVQFSTLEGMPVFLSHGQWRERGFFVQAIGGGIRYSLGGSNDCAGGRLEPGRWYYVVCTYDMRQMRVYLNGREVARRDAPQVDAAPWVGPFYVGRYTLEGKPYEVTGLVDEVKIYQRARSAEEIRQEYERVVSRVRAASPAPAKDR